MPGQLAECMLVQCTVGIAKLFMCFFVVDALLVVTALDGLALACKDMSPKALRGAAAVCPSAHIML
jgi:hypothetical protein